MHTWPSSCHNVPLALSYLWHIWRPRDAFLPSLVKEIYIEIRAINFAEVSPSPPFPHGLPYLLTLFAPLATASSSISCVFCMHCMAGRRHLLPLHAPVGHEQWIHYELCVCVCLLCVRIDVCESWALPVEVVNGIADEQDEMSWVETRLGGTFTYFFACSDML